MTDASKAIDFIQSLTVPEGPKAGKPIKLAKFQRDFIRGSLKRSTAVAVLSVGRGNGKSALSAGLALGALLGIWDRQPRREVLIAARTRDQARVAFDFAAGFAQSLPDELQAELTLRRNPRLEIEYSGDGGEHLLRVIASDSKNALGSAPTFVLMDERGHWPPDKGEDLEATLLSGLGKRNGRALIISTSASDDQHSFSQWIDEPPPGTFVQEHRPPPGLPADDLDSLLIANPGAKAGIGSSVSWLQAQANRAIARGGSALSSFRLYNRNERVSGERRDMLLSVDDWLSAEVTDLPPREGGAVVGVDLGGSASMSAVAIYWPNTGRLEAFGAFPSTPSLADRGARDGVRDRYVEMQDRGELVTLGERVVPAAPFLTKIMDTLDGSPVTCFTADRYRQAEFAEAMTAANLREPMVWRGQGFRDGAEDVERFRRAVFDGEVSASPSLLLRSAFADAVTVSDVAGNRKLAKARATGRIDAAAAAILAVAEGARRKARPVAPARAPVWT
ncbi:terminase TerL endonuclease subunit [Spectribacter hydrogenooxidans]|uniref:Terminase TerL endonuclease subunit n=1 Tax=Spectribacter hydrogenoxidans TaxID=3075608 RepID=A0ABU3C0J1_9GAMM|nr:terminase TerL endonuclease subunit [Salinisphaera sp. W335]MDT0635045.1 terminase TerL endonuclease subunit [Salinisphaera sp. W335]